MIINSGNTKEDLSSASTKENGTLFVGEAKSISIYGHLFVEKLYSDIQDDSGFLGKRLISKELKFNPLRIQDSDLKKLIEIIKAGVTCDGLIIGHLSTEEYINSSCKIYWGNFSGSHQKGGITCLNLDIGIIPSRYQYSEGRGC